MTLNMAKYPADPGPWLESELSMYSESPSQYILGTHYTANMFA
jgi:hypothetical protein